MLLNLGFLINILYSIFLECEEFYLIIIASFFRTQFLFIIQFIYFFYIPICY
jgi:hypothetical protein